jgi:hypothetical protein
MMGSNVTKARRALALLETKGLDDMPWSIEASGSSVSVSVYTDRITEQQAREVKRQFGPFKVENGYSGKNLVTVCAIDDSFSMLVRLYNAYSCIELKPEEITEEKWADIQSKVRDGLVKIQDCTPVAAKSE